MIYILVCARVRDSAWGMERGGGGGGGGGNWSQRAAFRMNGGGGRPPRAYAGSGAAPNPSYAYVIEKLTISCFSCPVLK